MHTSSQFLAVQGSRPDVGAGAAALRLAVSLLLLCAGLSAATRRHGEVGVYLLTAVAMGILWGARPGDSVRHLRNATLFLAVFFILLVGFNWKPPFREVQLGSIHFSMPPDAVSFGLAAVERGLLAVLIGAALFLSTGPTGLLAGLRRLRAPESAGTVLFLMFRYAGVLAMEAGRIGTARRSRELGGWRPRFGILLQISRNFLVRTYDRSERVYLAMCSRGFDGRIPILADAPVERREWLVGGGIVVLIVFVKIYFLR